MEFIQGIGRGVEGKAEREDEERSRVEACHEHLDRGGGEWKEGGGKELERGEESKRQWRGKQTLL